MRKAKIFISHSSKDKLVVDALVELLIRAGINESDILSSTTPGTHLHTGDGLYTELRHTLNEDNLLAIFLLSENFYKSAVCLNEMGAVWIKEAKFQYMVLPGFSFEKIRGVIRQDERLGISLAPIDTMTRTRFFDLKQAIEDQFAFEINESTWERARDSFFESVKSYEQLNLEQHFINMDNAFGYCIGDFSHDGCAVIPQESSFGKTTALIDFHATEAELCSIIFPVEQQDWSQYFQKNALICFDIYTQYGDKMVQAELEVAFGCSPNRSFPILISAQAQQYKVPPKQFKTPTIAWQDVREIHVLFHRKNVLTKTKVIIEKLHLEE